MNGILGKKIGMTRTFNKDGNVIPLSVIKVGPCHITGVKTLEKDGYEAVQLGFEDIDKKRVKKPQEVYFSKNKLNPKKFLKEIRGVLPKDQESELKVGSQIKASIFTEGDFIDVSGIAKGKGFQGGVKRWGWSIGPRTHGSRHQRAPGSIGASADPARVVKGKHMPGRMGGKKATIKNLEVVNVEASEDIITVKGNIPGSNGTYLVIKRSKSNKTKVAKKETKK